MPDLVSLSVPELVSLSVPDLVSLSVPGLVSLSVPDLVFCRFHLVFYSNDLVSLSVWGPDCRYFLLCNPPTPFQKDPKTPPCRKRRYSPRGVR